MARAVAACFDKAIDGISPRDAHCHFASCYVDDALLSLYATPDASVACYCRCAALLRALPMLMLPLMFSRHVDKDDAAALLTPFTMRRRHLRRRCR